MLKKLFPVVEGLGIGAALAGLVIGILFLLNTATPQLVSPIAMTTNQQVIGFLPYWLADKARQDYSQDITTLAYFALRVQNDGSIVKLNSPTEAEPGWHALSSGKMTPFLHNALQHNIKLSLVIDSGSIDAINGLIATPSANAKRLVQATAPLMQKYHFTDLNLDIEYTQDASPAAQAHFTQFVQEVRNILPQTYTLTLETSPIDAIEKRLIDIPSVAPYVNNIVIMAYDYHAPDSFVTGPIAPLYGAGSESEYDVATAVEQTLRFIPPQKLILGVPLYGYEWEVLDPVPRSAVIPGSGVLASNDRIENLLNSCATCSAKVDNVAKESYLTYFSTDTNSNHLAFFPNKASMQAKVQFAQQNGLGGIALWALGYEGKTILSPLESYK